MQAKGPRLNGPWGRLAWTLPVALVLTTLGLAGFLDVLIRGLSPPPTSNSVALQIVELPPEQPQADTPSTRETIPATPSQPPSPPPKPPAIETPPPTPAQPPPTPKPATEASLPLPPPPPPAPAYPSKRETTPVHPQQSSEANMPPLHRDLMRTSPQRPTVSSTEAAPLRRSSTGGITMGARALYRPMPDIPEELRHRELAVVAMARFHVAADGSATVTLLQATADPRLNAALMSALQKWRFFPAMDSGRPIPSTIDIRVPIQVR